MGRMVIGLVMAIVLAGNSGKVEAAEASAAVSVVSAYVWRGITFNDGLVVQPAVDVRGGGFGINVWGNLDVDDYGDTLESGEFSEIDITMSYGFDLEGAAITAGVIEYLFPNGGEGTREAFLSLSKDLFSGFTAGIGGYYDFDEVDDYYIGLSVGYAHGFETGLNLGLGALAGYAGKEMSAGEDRGLHEYTFTVNAEYEFTEALGLGAFVAYTGTFDEDVLPEQDVDFYGGVSIACSF